MKGRVLTVLRPTLPGDLGITMTHEHIIIDLSPVILDVEEVNK